MERVITYIDGFNLYFGLRESGWKSLYWLNLAELSRQLLKPHQSLERVKYFTSRITAKPFDPDKPKRQNTFLEALQTLPDIDIFYGHYLEKPAKCLKCGAIWRTHEEKMTDVNIAVQLLTDAQKNRYDTALLISGDSDLYGPLESIRQNFPEKRIVIAFPPARNSRQLKSVAHAHFVIGRKKLADSQFPDRVAKADGFILERPAQWR